VKSLLIVLLAVVAATEVVFPLPSPPIETISPIATVLEQRLSQLMTEVGLSNGVNSVAFNSPDLVPTNQSLALATVEDAQRYFLYCGAVYCYGSKLLTSWSCGYCKTLGPSVRFYATMFNATTQMAGMINIDDERQEIVVTFRGSYGSTNFVLDAMVTPVPFAGVNEAVRVHKGQLAAARSIYGQLRKHLVDLTADYPGYRLVFVGHSLGGNVATLALLMSRADPEFQSKSFAHFSYGAPRVGDHAFAQWVNGMDFTVARVVNFDDLAPHMFPTTDVYTHFGTEYWIDQLNGVETRICARNVTEDPNCSNSLAPIYNFADHLAYYGNSVVQCGTEDPVNGLVQLL